jgi:hypothetical protein
VISLVSRNFLQIHKDYPSLRKEWRVTNLVTPPMVRRFIKIAPSVEKLEASWEGYQEFGALPQLLMVAATNAPKLQELSIRTNGHDQKIVLLMDSVQFFSQIKKLSLSKIWLDGKKLASIHLSGLRSLQVYHRTNCLIADPRVTVILTPDHVQRSFMINYNDFRSMHSRCIPKAAN